MLGLVCRDRGENALERRLVVAGDTTRAAVGVLRRALLQGRVDEKTVGIRLPLRCEACVHVGVLHRLDLAHLEETRVPYVVANDRPVAILLRRPKVVPGAPRVVVAQSGGDHPVKVGQALLGEQIQGDSGSHRVREATGTLADACGVGLLVFVHLLVRGEKIARKPELALAQMIVHEALDKRLQRLQHLGLARRLVGVVALGGYQYVHEWAPCGSDRSRGARVDPGGAEHAISEAMELFEM